MLIHYVKVTGFPRADARYSRKDVMDAAGEGTGAIKEVGRFAREAVAGRASPDGLRCYLFA